MARLPLTEVRAGERRRIREEPRVHGKSGTRSRRIVDVTAGRPAGDVEGGPADVRIEGENCQIG